MSETKRSQSAASFEAFSDHQKTLSTFDFFINPIDPFAPHPEVFESELDSSLSGLEGSLEAFNNTLFTIPRGDIFYNTPSLFTTSSDSAYDTVSTHSESFYNYPASPYSPTSFPHNLDLDMDLNQVHTGGGSEYGGSVALSALDHANDPTSFGALPPTPPRTPIATNKIYNNRSYANTSCFSDYSPGSSTVGTDQFFASIEFGNTHVNHSTVAPMNVSTGSLAPAPTVLEDQKLDPRRKHKCLKCTRAFARAFNLKTHMATHDPNRLKPHICPHRNCGRSFSRKHDLGRHLTSIHRDEGLGVRRPIGIAKAGRTWCDNCGKGGLLGRSVACDCHDIK